MIFLSCLAIALAARAGAQMNTSGRLVARIRASELAWGQVEKGLSYLKGKKDTTVWQYSVEGFQVQNEGGRVSLNSASLEALTALLKKSEVKTDFSPEEIAAAIVDWRDADSEVTPSGAESDYYSALASPYPCKNAPFESIEELLLVRGVTWELFTSLQPYMTIVGDGKVNLNTATVEVLAALGMSDALTEKIETFQRGDDQILGTEDDHQFSSVAAFPSELDDRIGLSGAELADAQNWSASALLTTDAPSYYRIIGSGSTAGKSIVKGFEAVVEKKTWEWMDWREV